MKRALVVVVVLLAAAEIVARLVVPGRTVDPADWGDPAASGACGGVEWSGAARGVRAATAGGGSDPRALGHAIGIVGGAFTAAPGLALEERWPERLAARARASGYDELVVRCGRDRLELVRELLRAPRAAGAGGPPAALVRHERGPDLLLLEIDPELAGADAAPWIVGGDAPAPVAFAPGASRLLDAFELLSLRRWRATQESAIAELAQRDGFTGRAAAQVKRRLDALLEETQARRGGEPPALLHAVLAERYGFSRTLQRKAIGAAWAGLFRELREEQRSLIVLVTGPTLPTLAVAHAAESIGHAVVHAPPFELDPQLRIALPAPRPAAIVHAQAADSVWVAASARGLVADAVAATPAQREIAAAIEQSHVSRGGSEEALLRLVDGLLAANLEIGRGAPPFAVLHGVGAGGRVGPGAKIELVLRRPPLATALIVRAEAPAGRRPPLVARWLVGDSVESAPSSPAALGPAAGRPGFERLEWTFPPPPSTGPFDYPGFEFELLPEPDGTPPPDLTLREALLVGSPPAGG